MDYSKWSYRHNAGIAVTLELLLNAGKKLSEIAHGDADFLIKVLTGKFILYCVPGLFCCFSCRRFGRLFLIKSKCPNMKDSA